MGEEVRGGEVKGKLLEALWGRDAEYYRKASEHVTRAASEGEYQWLSRWLPERGRVLEVGCGDGIHFEVLARPGIAWFGCDLSRLAVSLAARRSPAGGRPGLAVADAEALPFESASFEGVMAVSLLEHLPAPERALEQMIAVLAPRGRLCVVSPQYGAPLGASPCRSHWGAARFVRRFLRAHLPARGPATLGWDRVEPAVLAGRAYEGDEDTVVEPELTSLVRFLRARGLRVLDATSGLHWRTWRQGRMSLGQRIVRGLIEPIGRRNVPPYRFWGPLVCVCAERGSS